MSTRQRSGRESKGGKALLRPARDLPPAERDAAQTAISLVDDLVSRYEPREAEGFLRALHDQIVELWEELEHRGTPAPSLVESSDDLSDVLGAPLPAEERARVLRRLL